MTTRATVASIVRIDAGVARVDQDLVAVEAPLVIELHAPACGIVRSLGVFMRTPGNDEDLVRGLLYSEGIIRRREDMSSMSLDRTANRSRPDIARAELAPHIDVSALQTDRASIATS